MIKLSWFIPDTLNATTSIPIKRKQRELTTQVEATCSMKADTAMVYATAKACQQPPQAGK